MSNLKTARQAILAELKHVEEGVAYYQKRAAALRAVLEQLEGSDNPVTTATRTSKVSHKASKQSKPAVARKTSASKQALPKTSRDFWLSFIGPEPKTAAEIGNAAVASLDFTPTSEQAKQLKSRLAPTLQALLKAKAVKDTGARRDRKYSLTSSGSVKGKARSMKSKPNLGGSLNGSTVHP